MNMNDFEEQLIIFFTFDLWEVVVLLYDWSGEDEAELLLLLLHQVLPLQDLRPDAKSDRLNDSL